MRHLASLTSRLVVTVVVLVAIVAALIGTATALAMRANLTQQLDARVLAAGGRVAHHDPDDDHPPPPLEPGGEYRSGEPGTMIAVFTSTAYGGDILGRDSGNDTSLTKAQLSELREVPVDGRVHPIDLGKAGSYRVVASSQGAGVVVNGLPTKNVDNAVRTLVWLEIGLGLLAVATAGSIGLVVVRRQLRPLREVASTAHAVAELPLASGSIDLTERVPDHLTDERTEVGQVGSALNTLLAHVETSLDVRHRSEQQVRRFVADASHELRTPLTTIRGYAELSRRTPGDAATLSASMDKVSAEADRMTTLVDDMLLLARLDAGRPLLRERVDLTRMLLEAVGDARVVGPDHHWRLELPEEPLEVSGDEQRLHQVVTNLLGNARKYTPAGTTVTVSARTTDGKVEVVIADNGPGFPDDLAHRAFERFTRGDAARNRASGGVGLGLSIVAAIVRAHGGSVHLDSAPGRTRITVLLPAC